VGRQPGQPAGRPTGAAQRELSDARRKEALANPEVAADEADRILAEPTFGSREAEARAANPDTEEEEAQRLLEETSPVTEDQRPSDEVKKQG
jgi:hypothetical protein